MADAEIKAIEQASARRPISREAVVTAPVTGTITQRQIGVGEYINSSATGGNTPVFSIGDLSTVWLVANVREADVAQVQLNDKLDVHVMAYPNRIFEARITYVAPSIDPGTRRLTVRAAIVNTDNILKPEMFANFRIAKSDAAMAPAVPEDAIIHDGPKERVWVASEDKSIALRSIQTGRRHSGMVEVVDGLTTGETVITSGSIFIDRAAKGD